MVELLYKANQNNNGVLASEDVSAVMNAVVALGRDEDKKPLGYKFQENYKTPRVNESEVLVRVENSGICHTDLLCLDGILVKKGPRVPGHEFAGTVVAAGPNVDKGHLGRKYVALALYGGSGTQPNLSRDAVFTGVMVDGGFADYFKIKPEYLVEIPEGITTKQAFPGGDALLTSRHVVSRIYDHLDSAKDLVGVIYGVTGGLGLATALNCIAVGIQPENIYGIDVRSRFLDELSDVLGINTIDSGGALVADQIIKFNKGRKVDFAIDTFGSGGNIKKAYAGLKELAKNGVGDKSWQMDLKRFRVFLVEQFMQQGTVNDALKVVRKGGAVEVIGSRGDHILYPTGDFMATEINKNGPWGGCSWDAEVVLHDIKDERIPPKGLELLLGKELPFTAEGFEEGVRALRAGEIMGRIYFNMSK
jgi:D-arabinose 1-dehydrogenase-like Zn-dependent alcohol dehydrogenase